MVSSSVNLVFIVLISWGAMTLVSSTPEMCINELSFLGTVDGKSYFSEKINKNWAAAKKRCDTAGMHLATITTSAQLTFLKTLHNVTGSVYYWTGARDAQTSTQFLWDYNNSTLSSSLFTGFILHIGIKTCVAYRATSAIASSFHFISCESPFFTMCEIVHNRNG